MTKISRSIGDSILPRKRPRRTEGKSRTGAVTEQAEHQNHDLQHRASLLANLPPKRKPHPISMPTHPSLICSPRWKTTSRLWLHKPLCSSNTHNKQGLIKPSNSQASSNQASRCLNSSSPSCRKTHKAPIPFRCNSSSNLNNNYSHSLQEQDLGDTRLNRSVLRTALRRYHKTACQISRSNSKCNCPQSLNQYNNSRHLRIRSASQCCRVRLVRSSQSY